MVRARKKKVVFDLRKENPAGRVDVLTVNLLERLAARVPELTPILDEKREVIHASVNELLGPHALPGLQESMQQIKPYLPLIGRALNEVVKQQQKAGATT